LRNDVKHTPTVTGNFKLHLFEWERDEMHNAARAHSEEVSTSNRDTQHVLRRG